MKIIKLTFWLNPTTLESVGGPRWDGELVYADDEGNKTHARLVGVSKEVAVGHIELAMNMTKNPKGE